MSDEPKKVKYIAGCIGRLQVCEDTYPLIAIKSTSHEAFSKRTFERVSIHVRGLSSYAFDAPKHGRVVEWKNDGRCVVCRVADDEVLAEVARMDAAIADAEARLAMLRRERQEIMEAALPRLEVAPVAREIRDCTDRARLARERAARETVEPNFGEGTSDE